MAGVARVVLQEHAGIRGALWEDADLERCWRRTGRGRNSGMGWRRARCLAMAKRGVTLTDVAARDTLFSDLDLALRALLLSQAGPQAGRVLHVLPTAAELRLPSELFRIVLLRRLRMPLPASAVTAAGASPMLWVHVAACPASGVLRTRAAPVERAIARVCREEGGRVAMHVQVAEMNVE